MRLLLIEALSRKHQAPPGMDIRRAGCGAPSQKMLGRHLLQPERAILCPSRAAPKAAASPGLGDGEIHTPEMRTASLALLVMTGEYEIVRAFALNAGLSGGELIQEIRGMCRTLIEGCRGAEPELAVDALPDIVEIAKEFGLQREKDEAVLEWCRLLLDAGEGLRAGEIAKRELSPVALQAFTEECLEDVARRLKNLSRNLGPEEEE